MKKILMGLVAVSTLTMSQAVPPTLTNSPAADTPIFSNGQQGAISIEGIISTNAAPVKYVVFAATDDGSNPGTTGDTVLRFPKFYLSTISDQGGFKGATVPKVYVKAVDAGNSAADITMGTVEFKLEIDPAFTNAKAGLERENEGWFSSGTKQLQFIVLTTKATVDSRIPSGYILGGAGTIFKDMNSSGTIDSGDLIYPTKKILEMTASNGVLTSAEAEWTAPSTDTPYMGLAEIQVVDNALAGDNNLGSCRILARVK